MLYRRGAFCFALTSIFSYGREVLLSRALHCGGGPFDPIIFSSTFNFLLLHSSPRNIRHSPGPLPARTRAVCSLTREHFLLPSMSPSLSFLSSHFIFLHSVSPFSKVLGAVWRPFWQAAQVLYFSHLTSDHLLWLTLCPSPVQWVKP